MHVDRNHKRIHFWNPRTIHATKLPNASATSGPPMQNKAKPIHGMP
jgi:hypothetical protein